MLYQAKLHHVGGCHIYVVVGKTCLFLHLACILAKRTYWPPTEFNASRNIKAPASVAHAAHADAAFSLSASSWKLEPWPRGHLVWSAQADASAPGGEIELREVVVRDAPPVEEEEEGKKPDDPSDAEEEKSDASKHPSLATSLSSSARFCRICIEPVEDAQLESGDATHLGCACVSGFMHRDCAVAFVLAKRRGPPTASLRCEVCLEDMVYLDELAREMREIGRQRRRARAALVALNRAHGGGAAPDPNRTARTGGRTANGRGRYFSAAAWAATPTRGGAGDDDVRFDVDDPRRDRPGWGSRNPLAWIAWIVTRPLALIFWVRYVGDRSAAAACRVFSFSPPPRRRKPNFFFAHRR